MITHESSLENFNEQIEYALGNYKLHSVKKSEIENIVLGGLGGSGIGAQFVKNFFFKISDLPIEVVSDYHLPQFVNNKSLVVLSSYSGNTEETLSMFEEALSANAKIIILTSGGALLELAESNNCLVHLIPKGYQPRMALGFSFGINLQIVGKFFDFETIKQELQNTLSQFKHKEEWKNKAEEIVAYFTKSIRDKFVLVADFNATAVATRFAQQIQENAKLEAFVNILPENNHNVLESYYSKLPSNIFLLNGNSNERVNLRFQFLKTILDKNAIPYVSIDFDGGILSEIFKTVHILDWFSVLASNEVGANNMRVPNIDELKIFLSNN